MLKFIKSEIGKLRHDERLLFISIIVLGVILVAFRAHAVDIPGSDFSGELDTLGSITKTTDKITFGWIRPFAAGVFLIIGCVGLVRSHFLLLVLGFGAALIILLRWRFDSYNEFASSHGAALCMTTKKFAEKVVFRFIRRCLSLSWYSIIWN
ncbi:MAG: hypothetical protein B7Y39_02615 [Bdellovibrio sp. 28-41-41]|nr:MAG: hypothetical protein B7Y39_02615 [Bdellovibrio sp. 28-41-41]